MPAATTSNKEAVEDFLKNHAPILLKVMSEAHIGHPEPNRDDARSVNAISALNYHLGIIEQVDDKAHTGYADTLEKLIPRLEKVSEEWFPNHPTTLKWEGMLGDLRELKATLEANVAAKMATQQAK